MLNKRPVAVSIQMKLLFTQINLTFTSKFVKWTIPSLNLDKATVENRGVNQISRTKWQIVYALIWIYTASVLVWGFKELWLSKEAKSEWKIIPRRKEGKKRRTRRRVIETISADGTHFKWLGGESKESRKWHETGRRSCSETNTVELQWLEPRWLVYHGWVKHVLESAGVSSKYDIWII